MSTPSVASGGSLGMLSCSKIAGVQPPVRDARNRCIALNRDEQGESKGPLSAISSKVLADSQGAGAKSDGWPLNPDLATL